MPLRSLDLPVPDVDKQCRLLGPTALVVQALMGIMVITSLLYKRYREKPQRAWRIWIFDVSKQVVGQAILHGSNVLVSSHGAQKTLRNPCVMYFLNILIDTTVGVAIIYTLLHLFNHVLIANLHFRGFESGVYGDPPSFKWWTQQATVYVVVLLLMKMIVVLALSLFPWLTQMGKWLLSWTGGRNAVQVIFVMGVFPVTMNVLQFWIIDSIVKFQNTPVEDGTSESGAIPADREPLVLGDQTLDPDDEFDLEAGHARRRPSPGRLVTLSIPDDRPATLASPAPSAPKTMRRRSPPPSPSPTTSYGSLGEDGSISQMVLSGTLKYVLQVQSDLSAQQKTPTDGKRGNIPIRSHPIRPYTFT
ncbi:hypothetical protein BS47DRAFT_1385683 [Hydnum rufescens UP504]|uniref:Vacuolar membrane protein n=1 Tax=Hydnum rufescens UP504 TaxID=1448309 RepID=A0A9P6AIS6_9AGAM|nr:hypothetical protein BS47DRAFT_1385683 [Hydnum rufescens UP504]